MAPVSILMFSGSTRQGSVNTKLTAAVAKIATDKGADTNHVSLDEFSAPIFNADWQDENGIPDTITRLGELMANADACFIASPEYNSGMSALLKNSIDWLSRLQPHPIKETLFSLGGASPGALGGVRGLVSLRMTLVGLGALVMPEQLSVGGAFSAFKEDGTLANERADTLAQAQVERLIRTAEKLRA